jgi:excisionase family DNA binding protein
LLAAGGTTPVDVAGVLDPAGALMADGLAAALIEELLALPDDELRPLADRLAAFRAAATAGGELLTVAQAAERLGVHPNTVYRMIACGRLRAAKVGRLWRIPESDLGRIEPASDGSRIPQRVRAVAPSRRFGRLVRELPYAGS